MGHLQAEQFPRPRRSLPAEVGRDLEQHLPQFGQKAGVHLDLAVASPLVEEALLTSVAVPPRGPDDRGRSTAKVASDLLPRESLSELGDHQETEGGLRVLGLSASVDQSTYLSAIESRYCVHGKVSIVGVGLVTTTIDGFTFPFNFLPANRAPSADPESRAVV
jgi:hypothetical protein